MKNNYEERLKKAHLKDIEAQKEFVRLNDTVIEAEKALEDAVKSAGSVGHYRHYHTNFELETQKILNELKVKDEK